MAESIVGPWAKDKLACLGKYLHAYTEIMKGQAWCKGYHYIDAFAGPGDHEIRQSEADRRSTAKQALLDVSIFGSRQHEQREFVAGSPRVALDLKHPFTNYVFVERSAERIAALKKLKDEYGSNRRIHIREADCTKYLREKVTKNLEIDWKVNRAVIFLDPFGMQVGWQTIADIAATKAIEVFLNFPVGMAIQRLLLRRGANFSDAQRKRLDDYFGSSEWVDVLYRRRETLFGDSDHQKIEQSGAALLKWYRSRLKEIFTHVSTAKLFRNTRGGHLYYLMLASHNRHAVKIANHVLSAGEAVYPSDDPAA